MKKLLIIFALLIVAICSQSGFAQSQKDKDRASFISNARLLEQKPFDKNAEAARQLGFKYVADTDEVSVQLCSDTMKLIPEKKNKFKGELLMQFTFGMAVFKLENPEQKNDEKAAQFAGIESMLKAYSAMVTENEKAKSPGMDELLAKRNKGELKQLVDAINCEKKSGK